MSKDEKIYKAINFGAALVATVVIISVSVTTVVLARPLYYWDIEHLGIPETSGISAQACRLNYDTLIDYNLLGGGPELVFPTLPMSEEAGIHFEEVKNIFTAMQIICIAGAALLAVWAAYTGKKRLRGHKYTAWMRLTGIVTLLVAAVTGIAVAVDWQWAFETMHKIFFRNDYWMFDPYSDPIIKILPDKFFMHCGISIVSLTILQIGVLEWEYRRLNK